MVDLLVSPDAESVLTQLVERKRLSAPSLLDVELISALRRLVRGGRLSVLRAEEAMDDFDMVPVSRWNTGPDLRRRVFQLRDNFSAYDASYVALAEALDCPLLTRDARLAQAAGRLVEVELV